MSSTNVLELKSSSLSLVSLLLKTTDIKSVLAELESRIARSPDFFENEAIMVDLSEIDNASVGFDVAALCHSLRQYRINPVAIRSDHAGHLASAELAGLFPSPAVRAMARRDDMQIATGPPRGAEPATESPKGALVIDRPLRSGQHVYARGRDLVVMSIVSPGAEIMADGHIHVYSALRGRAIAGARGDADARIFAQSLEAELIAIAGIYRTGDVALPQSVGGKAAQVFLRDEKLVVQSL